MTNIHVYDFAPSIPDVLQELLSGLQQTPKYLSAKFNYDEQGAMLYEKICQTDDYYLTRIEHDIMQKYTLQIIDCFSDPILLVEYGSGNAQKTRFFFDHLPNLIGYIPIDISRQQLIEISTAIAAKYPHIEVLPVCADYTRFFEHPRPSRPFSRQLVYYPGSTIGNIHPHEAIAFLKHIHRHCQLGDALVIGVDLQKDPCMLERAYDDREGITRQFNLINPLRRFNREFDADFVIAQYQHCASYNKALARVDIYLKSLCDQTIHLNGETIRFAAGERLDRAVAYKYTVTAFQKLVRQAGWRSEQVWTDEKQWFSVHYLTAIDAG